MKTFNYRGYVINVSPVENNLGKGYRAVFYPETVVDTNLNRRVYESYATGATEASVVNQTAVLINAVCV